MWRFIKDKSRWSYETFHASETILWARIQMFAGAVFLVASTSDVSPFFSNPKHLAIWTMTNGIITEYLRRRNADWHRMGPPDA